MHKDKNLTLKFILKFLNGNPNKDYSITNNVTEPPVTEEISTVGTEVLILSRSGVVPPIITNESGRNKQNFTFTYGEDRVLNLQLDEH